MRTMRLAVALLILSVAVAACTSASVPPPGAAPSSRIWQRTLRVSASPLAVEVARDRVAVLSDPARDAGLMLPPGCTISERRGRWLVVTFAAVDSAARLEAMASALTTAVGIDASAVSPVLDHAGQTQGFLTRRVAIIVAADTNVSQVIAGLPLRLVETIGPTTHVLEVTAPGVWAVMDVLDALAARPRVVSVEPVLEKRMQLRSQVAVPAQER